MVRCQSLWFIPLLLHVLALPDVSGALLSQEPAEPQVVTSPPTAEPTEPIVEVLPPIIDSKPLQNPPPAATTESVEMIHGTPFNEQAKVIIIETTPDIERSELIRKVVEALENDGQARRTEINRVGKPVAFEAILSPRSDVPQEKLMNLIDTLKSLGVDRMSFRVVTDPSENKSSVFVQCPADATWRNVQTIIERLQESGDFTVDVRVASSDEPVTPTIAVRQPDDSLPAQGEMLPPPTDLPNDVQFLSESLEDASPPEQQNAMFPLTVSILPDGQEDEEFLAHLQTLEAEGVIGIVWGEPGPADLTVTIDGPPLTAPDQFQAILRKLHGLQISSRQFVVAVKPQPRTDTRQTSVAQVRTRPGVNQDSLQRVLNVLRQEPRFSVLGQTKDGIKNLHTDKSVPEDPAAPMPIPGSTPAPDVPSQSEEDDPASVRPHPGRAEAALRSYRYQPIRYWQTGDELKVFRLKYADARGVHDIFQTLYGPTHSIAVDARTNSMIFNGSPQDALVIEALLAKLDEPTPTLSEKKNALSGQSGDPETQLTAPSGTAPHGLDLVFNEIVSAGSNFSFSIEFADQTASELRQQYSSLEQRAHTLAQQLREPIPDPQAGDRLKSQLRKTVQQAFEARQKLHRAELAEYAQRLKSIHESIEMRDRIAQQIIDHRVKELLDPDLKWEKSEVDSGPALSSP